MQTHKTYWEGVAYNRYDGGYDRIEILEYRDTDRGWGPEYWVSVYVNGDYHDGINSLDDLKGEYEDFYAGPELINLTTPLTPEAVWPNGEQSE